MKRERHGYEIHHLLSSSLGRVWYTGMSQTYALLKRLEADEKVVSGIEVQHTRPARNIYSITPKGRKAFLAWVHAPLARMRDLRLEFLAKLFFIKELNLSGFEKLLQKQTNVCQEQFLTITQKDATCDNRFDHLVHRFRISQIEAILSWLRECEQQL